MIPLLTRVANPPAAEALRREYWLLHAEKSGRARGRTWASPLFAVGWRRVVVDEVQEVEGKASRAAQMARALRSRARWGVSGTPVTKGLGAFKGLIDFLQASMLLFPHAMSNSRWTAGVTTA